MKKMAKRVLSMLLAICVIFTLLPATAFAASADNMVTIAKAEVGTSGSPNKYTRWNGTINRSYDYWWCAAFVSWVANQAGESAAVPKTASVYVMANGILNAGGKRVTSPQAGDIVVYRRIADNYYAHVGIMESSTTSIEGNYGNAVCRGIRPSTYSDGAGSSVSNGRIEVIYLRPNYKNASISVTVQSYIDCNVQITTTKGKQVDLYSNPTDSNAKTYFDQGQTAYSTRGAKLSNGTTWYEIQAIDNGKTVTLWLNAASSGVTVINRKVESSLSFSPNSLSLAPNSSKTVSITFKGDEIYNLSYGIGDNSVCSASWGSVDYTIGKTSLTVTGKVGGSTKITIYLNDKSGNSLYSQSINVSVTTPTYTVSYNANGGSGAPSSQTKTYGKNLMLSSQKPTRSGYTFKGWATASNSSSASYQPGSTYSGNSNLTLYAVWVLSVPTVKEYFSCNVQINTTKGKTVNLYSKLTDSTRNTYFDQGQTAYSTRGAKLSDGTTWYEIQAIDNGKVVTLWLNAASSGVDVVDKKIDPSLSFSPSSLSLELGASKTVSITFKGDGIYNLSYGIGDNSVCSASWGSVDYSTGKTSLTVAGKSGGSTKITIYLNDKNGNSLYSQSISIAVTAPTYTVSYNANGGSGAPASQTKQYNKALTLSSVKPTRSGYSFKGWSISSGASGAQYQPGESYTSNQNLTLYAVWERSKVESSLTFSPNALTMEPSASKTVSISFKGEDIKKLHYTIHNSSVCDLSWGSTDLEKGTSSLTITGKNPGTTTVTVYFLDDEGKFFFSKDFNVTVSSPSYTVSYNANGGSGAPSTQTKQYNKTLTISSVKPSRDGYTFIGWAESSNASSAQVQYHSGDSYTENRALTLYAVWMATKPDHQHNLIHVSAKVATETSTGNIEYWQCAGCGKYFADGNATQEISQQQTIIATIQHVHSLTHTPAKAATETAEGNIEHWQCTSCGKYFADSNAAQEISLAQTVFQRTEHVHTLHEHQSVPSTCTQSGSIAYWTCEGCGKSFADAAGSREVTSSQLTLAPLGHNYVNGVCTRDGARDPNYSSSTNLGHDTDGAPSVEVHLPKQAVYTQGYFTDVYPNQWFTEVVAEAYEMGLMKGKSARVFDPYGSVTVAEAITMACRIHSIYTKGYEGIPQSDGAWYQGYLDYAYANGIVSWEDYNSVNVSGAATRAQFAQIMAKALPEEGFYAMNSVANNAIPDVSMSDSFSSSVYKLYRAGILSGGDVNGTFFPETYITRAESAAIVARIANSKNRVQFALT